jgi:hypothetical protein
VATTKRKVVLIYGQPGDGKSHLANNELKAKYGYHVVTVDEVYVAFVQCRFPDLYFPQLRQFTQQHYEAIVVPGVKSGVLIEDVAQAWQDHLCAVIERESRLHKLLAVEGYLLYPALEAIENRLTPATVLRVDVRGKTYFIANSVEEIHNCRRNTTKIGSRVTRFPVRKLNTKRTRG